jgi:hypothetical protein
MNEELGTQRGQMKVVLSWLVRWACRAGTRDFYNALAAQVGQVKKFPSPHTISIPLSHRAASSAGSRAGTPVY